MLSQIKAWLIYYVQLNVQYFHFLQYPNLIAKSEDDYWHLDFTIVKSILTIYNSWNFLRAFHKLFDKKIHTNPVKTFSILIEGITSDESDLTGNNVKRNNKPPLQKTSKVKFETWLESITTITTHEGFSRQPGALKQWMYKTFYSTDGRWKGCSAKNGNLWVFIPPCAELPWALKISLIHKNITIWPWVHLHHHF